MIFTAEHIRSVIDNWKPEWEQLNLSNVVVKYGANLRGANLRGANLSGADLRDADLGGANLGGANLYGANLSDANLSDANLYGANLRDANLRDANLYGANLYGANLSDANLSDANLSGADLRGAVGIVAFYGAGDYRRMMFAYNKDGIRFQCGCFNGTADELKAAIERKYAGNAQGTAYLAAVDAMALILQAQS